MLLLTQRYGKQRVRLLRVARDGARHSVKEIDASVLLGGRFDGSYLGDDNISVVPTDTMKNTVHALAKEHLRGSIEEFAQFLGRHFLGKYPQIETVEIELKERVWQRMAIDGHEHPHAFTERGQGTPFTACTATRDACEIHSGIRDLLVMKSTGSAFAGFPRCEFTTLPEAADRVFATSLQARWTWTRDPESFEQANDRVLAAMLKVFAENFSPSVQRTLFEMGEAALEAVPEIGRVELALPNKHYLQIDLSRFGMTNENEIFFPTDEPHGQITATIGRE